MKLKCYVVGRRCARSNGKRFAQRNKPGAYDRLLNKPTGLAQARPDFPEIAECYDVREFIEIDDSTDEPSRHSGARREHCLANTGLRSSSFPEIHPARRSYSLADLDFPRAVHVFLLPIACFVSQAEALSVGTYRGKGR